MTYKQIETMREIRLWVGQIVVPVCTVAAVALSNPEVRNAVSEKVRITKQQIKNKFIRK